ncbi:MAG: hypothetical protein ACLPYY_14735 [Acidimicrobiales bacterium]
MSVEMEPEGVLLHLLGDNETGSDSALWHLADVQRALTSCGIDVGYGNPRKPWAETPADRRCQMCEGQLAERRPARG